MYYILNWPTTITDLRNVYFLFGFTLLINDHTKYISIGVEIVQTAKMALNSKDQELKYS